MREATFLILKKLNLNFFFLIEREKETERATCTHTHLSLVHSPNAWNSQLDCRQTKSKTIPPVFPWTQQASGYLGHLHCPCLQQQKAGVRRQSTESNPAESLVTRLNACAHTSALLHSLQSFNPHLLPQELPMHTTALGSLQ